MRPYAAAPFALAILVTFGGMLSLVACGRSAKPAPSMAATSTQTTEPALPTDVAPVAGIAGTTPPTSPAAAPPAAAAATPGTADAAGTISATGQLVSPVRSELAVRLPGRVGRVMVDEGARVRKGQPLLELETQYLALDVEKADADLARARAAAQDARRDLARKEELIAKNAVAQAAYDRSQSAAAQADAGVASAEAARDLARQRLGDAVLRSPIDGVVAERRTDVGQRMGEATVAFVIAQTSPLKLQFRIPERYLSAVRRGQAVRATVDPYPRETFSGRVSLVGGVVDPATRSVNVETEFANRDGRLSPGLFARVELDLTQKPAPAGGKP